MPANKCNAKDYQLENVIVANRKEAATIVGSIEAASMKAAAIEGSTGATTLMGSAGPATIVGSTLRIVGKQVPKRAAQEQQPWGAALKQLL